MTTAYATFALLRAEGASRVVSTYVPILMTAALVATAERWRPYRREWVPALTDVRIDLAFMAIVQVALPPLVGLIFLNAIV